LEVVENKPYNGNNPRKKIFANCLFFQIHKKAFANIKLSGTTPLRTTPISPAKVTNLEALQSSMRQCSSYNGHTHSQLLDRVILQKF